MDTVSLYLLALETAGGWHRDKSQTDLGTNTLGNSATAADITKAWSIPAYDAQAGTSYMIEVPVTGTWEGQILNVGLMLNGAFTNVVPFSGAAFTTAHGVAGTIRCRVICTAAGSSGTIQTDIVAALSDSSANRTPSAALPGTGEHASLAFDTTAVNTIAIAASWGATATGQTLSGITSTLTRKGP